MGDYLTPSEKNKYCVCSVIQAILGSKGINFSQDEIARKLTPSEQGFLVDDGRMKDLFAGNGLSYEFYWRNEVPFNDPEFVLEEMQENQGFIGIGNHVFLFRSYDGSSLEVFDPENGEAKKISYDEMARRMKESGKGCFGLVKRLS